MVEGNQTPKIDNREIQTTQWFGSEELGKLNLEGFTKKALKILRM
jgi:hypothetical protein